jgi:peptide/nickel transport system permease protein
MAATDPITPAPRRQGTLQLYAAQFARNPLGLLGLVLVIVIIASAILAPWIVPYDPVQIFTGPRLGSPSWQHWLGTDQLGRDTLSRVIAGSRVAMLVALATLSAALSFGLALGLMAGFGPRWLDNILLLLFDAIRSFPVIVLGLALVTLLGPSLQSVILVVAISAVPIYGRIVRTQTQSLRNSEYILAERAMGASMLRILTVHILPNVIGPLLILASMDVPLVIAAEAGLSFLGLGVRPPTPGWGTILNDGYSVIRNSPWPVIAGSVPIIVVTLGFTFLGEALRDIFDPKLRRDL